MVDKYLQAVRKFEKKYYLRGYLAALKFAAKNSDPFNNCEISNAIEQTKLKIRRLRYGKKK